MISLFSYLERVRKAPQEKRRSIALLSAGAITLVIAILWISTYVVGGGGATTTPSLSSQEASTWRADLEKAKEGLSKLYGEIGAGLGDLGTTTAITEEGAAPTVSEAATTTP